MRKNGLQEVFTDGKKNALYVQFSVSLCFISLLRDKLPQITRVPWLYFRKKTAGGRGEPGWKRPPQGMELPSGWGRGAPSCQSSGPARPAQAQLRGGGRGTRARSEGPRSPALGRTAAGGAALALTLPGAPPGQPHSLPARPMPCLPGPRPLFF